MTVFLIDNLGNVAKVEPFTGAAGKKTFVREYREFSGEWYEFSRAEPEEVVSAMLSNGYSLTSGDAYFGKARRHFTKQLADLENEEFYHNKERIDSQPSIYEILEAA